MTGSLDILSCGNGHTSFNFDKDDPLETERASRIVEDMLRRGYALFIEGKGGKLTKVKRFNPKTASYIIAAGPDHQPEEYDDTVTKPAATKGGPKKSTQSVPMRKARATAIAPTAGG